MDSLHANQIFEYVFDDTRWLFHIGRAWEIIHWAKEMGVNPNLYVCKQEELNIICKVNCYIDPTKLRESDETIPGISVLLEHPASEQNPFAILIDGSHRAHRARQLETQFSSYVIPKELWTFALFTAKEVKAWEFSTNESDRVEKGEFKTLTREEMLKN